MNRSTSTRAADAAGLLTAIAFAVFAVSVDLHNDEVQATVLVILVGGFIAGAVQPANPWRWALILGLSVVLGDYAAPRLHWIARDPEPPNWGALVAIVPALIGSYVGAGLRKMLAAVSRTM